MKHIQILILLFFCSALTGAVRVHGAGEYELSAYSPTVAYDFRDEYPSIELPTQVLPGVAGVEGTYTIEWWCFIRGSNTHPSVTEAAWALNPTVTSSSMCSGSKT